MSEITVLPGVGVKFSTAYVGSAYRGTWAGHSHKDKDLFYFLNYIAREFRLFEWRDNLRFRRNLFRAATLKAVDAGLMDLAGLLAELKRLVHYNDLAANDRTAYRQWETWLRKVVKGWHLLGTASQRDFRNGKLQLSGLADRLRDLEASRLRRA